MDAFIVVKDRMLHAINYAENIDSLIRVCDTLILPLLEGAAELWDEQNYSYKAKEIAERAADRFHELSEISHHLAVKRSFPIKRRLNDVACYHGRLQRMKWSA